MDKAFPEWGELFLDAAVAPEKHGYKVVMYI